MKLEEIGKFIRHLRKLDKLTQEELSNKVGLSRGIIIDLEKGKANTSIKNLIDFLDQFDFELSLTAKGSSIEGTTDPLAVKIAEQIYNTVALNFGHTRDTKAKFGWVYIFKPIGESTPVKIGYTQLNTPQERIDQINAATPDDYEVYYAILDSDCRYTEKTMHLNFKEQQLGNEWFDVECEIAKEKLIEIAKNEADYNESKS